MKPFTQRFKIYLLLLILTGESPSAMAGADDPSLVLLPPSSWTSLSFDGSGTLAKVTTRIQLHDAAEMPGDLFEKTGEETLDCVETGENKKWVTVETMVRLIPFFTERYTEHLLFDAATGRACRRIRRRDGNDPWIKAYYWTPQGVRRQKISPAGANEKKQPPLQWTRRIQSIYTCPAESGCPLISDPGVLFHLLSVIESSGLPLPYVLCVFGRQQFHRLTLDNQPSVSMNVAFNLHSPPAENRVEAQIIPRVYSVSAEPIMPTTADPEKFSLLGLETDIRIHIDPSRRLPVRVSGKNAELGNLVLHLKDATLK
jgi:hypothetical protein